MYEKQSLMQRKYLIVALALGFFLCTITLLFFQLSHSDTATEGEFISKPTQSAAVAASTTAEDPFADISISGISAFVLDAKTQQVLYTKKPDEQVPLASITKLMTVALANELLKRDDSVTISAAAIAQDGTSAIQEGEIYTIGDLSDLTLVSSSNDGAYALAEAAGALFIEGGPSTFVQAMNIKSNELGLTKTYFRNPTGLDVAEGQSGTYSTARDVAFLMQHILFTQPEILEATTHTAFQVPVASGGTKQIYNTNYEADDIIGLIGSKTGYTELAGGNLVIAFDIEPNHPIIAVVLGSTKEGRFSDINTLLTATNELFK
jgi:serine-type D-Ala-D-Ala carboxypeptidase (penicillin-binding protein 5/6)